MQQRLGLTAVFVTHDQEEAVVLADRVALMLDGRVEQEGRPREFYERPATVRAARFFGTENLLPGTVRAGWFAGPLGSVAADGVREGPALLALRQEAVQVLTAGAPPVDGPPVPATAGVPAVVETLHYVGTALRVQARVGEVLVHAVTVADAAARPPATRSGCGCRPGTGTCCRPDRACRRRAEVQGLDGSAERRTVPAAENRAGRHLVAPRSRRAGA